MSLQYLLALLAIAVGGACIATQAPINSRLSSHVGDPVTAAAISFIVGAIILCAIAVARGAVPSLGQMAAAPWWAWVGGALGAVYVWAAVWSVGTLGVVTLVAALIFGQLTAALALDAIGAFGLQVREISWTRIAAIALVAAGLVLSRL
ncbi:DMT family transporter [Gymnodinialimonas sp. 2305UL16-5]|uniref:DMT family transporter n=1 Tax=Gymnodinialimonas mytili TaxID=3126503 RepID=UPI003097E10B